MSELGDYRRFVERPRIASYEATIASLRAKNEQLREALQNQMQSTILLLSKYEYSQQEIEDSTSQARRALEEEI